MTLEGHLGSEELSALLVMTELKESYSSPHSLWRCGFLTPPAAGALLRAASVANCLRGALPPVFLRAVCLVRAISKITVCQIAVYGSLSTSNSHPNIKLTWNNVYLGHSMCNLNSWHIRLMSSSDTIFTRNLQISIHFGSEIPCDIKDMSITRI